MIRSRITFIAAIFAIFVLFLSTSSNPPEGRTGAPGESLCSGCHSGSANYGGDITVSGITSAIMPNTTYNISVTLSGTALLSAARAGFELVVIDGNDNSGSASVGTFSNLGANTGTDNSGNRTYMEHRNAVVFGGSANANVTYTFDWTSPSDGANNDEYNMYYVGNVTNGSGQGGDEVVNKKLNMVVSGAVTSPTVAITKNQDVSCNGGNDGSATAVVSNGVDPITYAWSNGGSDATINNFAAGTYTVTITDGNNDTADAMVTITEPNPLTVTISKSDESSNNGNNVSATANPGGGTMSYSYLWSNGLTTQTISNLVPADYTVVVTDANGCTTMQTTTIRSFVCTLSATATNTSVSCNGGSDGSATANPSGGTSPFTYNWSNGSTNQTATGLSTGTYSVTVTDSKNCTAMVTNITVSEPTALTLNVSSTDETANNADDGTATATTGSGTPGYTYSWSTGGTTQTISGLVPGTYSVTVTDSNGCTIDGSTSVSGFVCDLMATTTVTDVACNGVNDGTAEANPSGGTSPFTYSWSNGGTTKKIENLIAGTYAVTVTDSKNCTATINNIVVAEPDALTLSISKTNETTSGGNDGTATANPGGGTMPYTFAWSTNATTATITGLTPGSFQVTVTDANGCTINASTTIDAFGCDLTASADVTSISCHGLTDGSITGNPKDGSGTYTYAWSNNETTQTISNLTAGTYDLTVTDSNNCTATVSNLVVVEPDTILISIDNSSHPTSAGATDGAIDVTVTGGTGTLVYDWELDGSDFSTMEDISTLGVGSYVLKITDDNSCAVESNAIVLEVTTSISQLNSKIAYDVFPIPTRSNIKVAFRGGNQYVNAVSIIDLFGKVVQHTDIESKISELVVDLQDRRSGVYLIRIDLEEGFLIQKIVKQN